MTKEKKILLNFGLYVLLGLVICIIGITNCFALTNDGRIDFYDNNGSSASYVSTSYIQQTGESTATFTTTANSYGGLVVITLDEPLVNGYIYTMFLNVGAGNNGGSTRLSTKNCIGIGDSKNSAINSYVNCNLSPRFSDYTSSTGDYTRGIYYTFIANKTAVYLALPYTSQYTCYDCPQYSYGYNINAIGDSNSLTETEVNNVINNQTNIINNSISNSENSIIQNQDRNANSIIENQNTNNEELKDTINDNFQNCYEQQNITFTTKNGYELDADGNEKQNSSWLVTDYIPVISGLTYSFTGFSSTYNVFYDANKNYVGKQFANEITIPNGVYYIRKNSQQSGYNGVITRHQGCLNRLDETNNTSKGILGKLGDLFSKLFSDEDADVSGLNNMVGWLPPGPVDSIINLPLSFFNALTNTLSGTCQDVTLVLPFVNQTLTLPCFDAYMSQYLEHFSTFWTLVGFIVSIFILYNYLLALYKWVDDTLTFRENNLPGYYGDNWGGGA